MKTLKLTFVLMFLLLITTCSNNDDDDGTNPDGEYYITFKANGNVISFTGSNNSNTAVGTFNTLEEGDTNQYASGITGVNDNNNTISILIGATEEMLVNTIYTNYSTSLPKIKADTYASGLSLDSGANYFGSLNEELILVIDGTVADCEIVFTEIDSNTLKGQFSGTWYDFANDNTAIVITDGEFNVRRY